MSVLRRVGPGELGCLGTAIGLIHERSTRGIDLGSERRDRCEQLASAEDILELLLGVESRGDDALRLLDRELGIDDAGSEVESDLALDVIESRDDGHCTGHLHRGIDLIAGNTRALGDLVRRHLEIERELMHGGDRVRATHVDALAVGDELVDDTLLVVLERDDEHRYEVDLGLDCGECAQLAVDDLDALGGFVGANWNAHAVLSDRLDERRRELGVRANVDADQELLRIQPPQDPGIVSDVVSGRERLDCGHGSGGDTRVGEWLASTRAGCLWLVGRGGAHGGCPSSVQRGCWGCGAPQFVQRFSLTNVVCQSCSHGVRSKGFGMTVFRISRGRRGYGSRALTVTRRSRVASAASWVMWRWSSSRPTPSVMGARISDAVASRIDCTSR